MKRVIRLTEGDLVKLIKKVMNEDTTSNDPDPKKSVEECLLANVEMKDITKYKNCIAVGLKISEQKIPSMDELKGAMTELKTNKEDSCKILPNFLNCVAKKVLYEELDETIKSAIQMVCNLGSMLPTDFPKIPTDFPKMPPYPKM